MGSAVECIYKIKINYRLKCKKDKNDKNNSSSGCLDAKTKCEILKEIALLSEFNYFLQKLPLNVFENVKSHSKSSNCKES